MSVLVFHCCPDWEFHLTESFNRGFCCIGWVLPKQSVEVINAHPHRAIRIGTIDRLARRVLRGEGSSAKELNIVFVNDREMKRLNREFLLQRGVTDVISFRLNEDDAIEGEVYVNLDQAARQAQVYGVSLTSEIQRLVIHGILHLVGYEDKTDSEKRLMHSREDRYLK